MRMPIEYLYRTWNIMKHKECLDQYHFVTVPHPCFKGILMGSFSPKLNSSLFVSTTYLTFHLWESASSFPQKTWCLSQNIQAQCYHLVDLSLSGSSLESEHCLHLPDCFVHQLYLLAAPFVSTNNTTTLWCLFNVCLSHYHLNSQSLVIFLTIIIICCCCWYHYHCYYYYCNGFTTWVHRRAYATRVEAVD